MKPKTSIAPVATLLLVALAVPALLAAQPSRYEVVDLGTLGGTFGWANGIDNGGSVAGFSTLPLDQNVHAFIWQKGVMTDLGTLGGPNSIPSFSPFSERGEIGGAAETSTPDPNGEDACFFGTQLTCRPVVWHDGTITELPTLGGNNGAANQVNNRGQVAGTAENTVPLPPCLQNQGLALPVIWENAAVLQLPLFPGDQAGVALAINDEGRAAGFSTSCTDGHALIWQDGTATDLGSLGGTFSGAAAINNQDQVVGNSNLSGDTTFHAFLWQNGVMTDLGTLPGHSSSAAFGINSKGQIVGQSCSDVECRAFLWQDGVMTDLNDLIPPDSSLFFFEPVSINSRGQIAGAALDMNTLETRAFLATPSEQEGADTTSAASHAKASRNQNVHISGDLRITLRHRRLVQRYSRLARRDW
jgi:probable HAF family extracellular repeat protein